MAYFHVRDTAVGLALHIANVTARRKRGSRTGHDIGAHVGVVVDPVDRCQEFGGIAGQRLTPLGLIHGACDDVAVLLVLQKIGPGISGKALP